MKFPKLDKILQNKYVLYVVSFIAIMNLFGYILMKNINAAIFFGLVGLLSSYFSKNMIVILTITILTTNLFVISKVNVVEAMSNRRKEQKKKAELKVDKKQKQVEHNENQPEANVEPMNTLKKNKSTNKIDYAQTLTDAYSNLQNQIGPDGIEGLTNQTKELMSQQNALMDNIKSIEPFLKTAKDFMGGLDIENLKGLGDMVSGTLNLGKKKE